MTPESVSPRRLGVFGGAFDPPHIGHTALLQAALADLELDQLRVVPTGQAWHKSWALSPADHRLAMAQLAFAHLPRVVVDPIEIERAGPSYTVETLQAFATQFPAADLYLILGEDQARALSNWHALPEVLRLAIICVAEREDITGDKRPPVSATDIRARIAAHLCVSPLVGEPVARYIDDHHLYQTI